MKLDKVDLVEARAVFEVLVNPMYHEAIWATAVERLRIVRRTYPKGSVLDSMRLAILAARRRNRPKGGRREP